MAQYNLLGGVQPTNPEYDIQNSMRGKGTNWAEYGLRKEQLKEQKKQNRINNVMQGINTALNVVNTGLAIKDNDLKRETRQLINTERGLDIQSKRIDISNKQKEATEDTTFADGLMSLIEAKDYEKVGPYIYGTNPKILQRNEGNTWSAIQLIRGQFGDDAADKLLQYALPSRAQELQKEKNANYRSQLAFRGQELNYKANELRAASNVEVQRLKNEAEYDKMLFGGLTGGAMFGSTGEAKAGVVNSKQADTYSNLQTNLNELLRLSDTNLNVSNVLNSYGLLKNGVLDQRMLATLRKNNDMTFDFLPVRDTLKQLQEMTGQSLEDFLKITGGKLPISFMPNLTASGEPVLDIETKKKTILTGSYMNSENTAQAVNYYNNGDTGANIIVVKRKGQIVTAFPVSENDTTVIKKAYDSFSDYVNTTANMEAEAQRRISAMLQLKNAPKEKIESFKKYMDATSVFDNETSNYSVPDEYLKNNADYTNELLTDEDVNKALTKYMYGKGLYGKPENFINADMYNQLVNPKKSITKEDLLKNPQKRIQAYKKVKSVLAEQFARAREDYTKTNSARYNNVLKENSRQSDISTIGSEVRASITNARTVMQNVQEDLKDTSWEAKARRLFNIAKHPFSRILPKAVSAVGGKYALRRWFGNYGDLPESVASGMDNIDNMLDNILPSSLDDKTERQLKTAFNNIANDLNNYYKTAPHFSEGSVYSDGTESEHGRKVSRINFRALTEDTTRIKDILKDWIEYALLKEAATGDSSELDLILQDINKYLVNLPSKELEKHKASLNEEQFKPVPKE